MDVVTYLLVIVLGIILLTAYLARKRNLNRHHSETQASKVTKNVPRKHKAANKISQRSTLKKENPAHETKSQRSVPIMEPASTSRMDQAESNSLTINGTGNTFASAKTPSPSSSSAAPDTEVLLLLPTEADNSLNTRNAFKSPPGNLRIFSLYSDFVNEVSDDVQNVTDSFLTGINTLIDSDYHLVHDDEWRDVMQQNARLAQMTSRYVKRYRYPHYAGHIHQMLVTCLTTVTHATDLIDESFANAIEGETEQAKSKLKNSQVLLNKSPKYLEYCNSAMGACYLELSRHI